MAQVVRNPDNTVTITFLAWEQRVLTQWASEHSRTPAKQLEDVVNGFLINRRADYRAAEGPAMRAQYDALSPAKQAEVDAILDTAPTEGPQT